VRLVDAGEDGDGLLQQARLAGMLLLSVEVLQAELGSVRVL